MTDEQFQQYIDNESRYADSLNATATMLTEARGHILDGIAVVKSLMAENRLLRDKPVADDDLFHFIEPSVIEYRDRLAIHLTVANLVKRNPLSAIWKYLKRMSEDGKIFLLDLTSRTVYDELVRMGMPGEGNGNETGYSRKTFEQFFTKETELRKSDNNVCVQEKRA